MGPYGEPSVHHTNAASPARKPPTPRPYAPLLVGQVFDLFHHGKGCVCLVGPVCGTLLFLFHFIHKVFMSIIFFAELIVEVPRHVGNRTRTERGEGEREETVKLECKYVCTRPEADTSHV